MNMVWMNNSGNAGMAGSNPMIIDENSIQFFNAQPVAGNMNQQQAQLMDMNSQMQGANFLSDFNGPTNSGTIANANDLFALQQQQQLQLQQQLNLAAQYGSIVNMGNILANSSSLTNDDQDDEEQEEEDEHNVEYDDENSSPSDYVIQQQQQQQQMIEQNNIQQQQLFFLQQQQQQQQQQQMIEQNNIQINDANYFLINNPHLFNNSNDDNNSMILQQNQLQQQLIMVNSKLAVGQQTSSTGELVSSSHKTTVTKKLKDSHKIMPVKRPGLKLKTPIAYFGNTDPSVIPIQKDGMGVCEKCGAIGVKHAFYTKERRFCSLSCARGFEEIGDTGNSSNSKSKKSAYKFKMEEMVHIKDENSGKSQSSSASSTLHNFMPQESMPQLIKPMNGSSGGLEDRHLSIRRKVPSEFVNSYDWKEQIIRTDFYAASVTNFSHAPGYDIWSDIVVGIKVEVENLDLKETDTHGGSNFQSTPFWIATVLKIHGYKAKLRYEGFENDHNHDFWVNLCTTEVHPVGWCATQGRQIIAPLKIENRVKNLKKYLLKSLHHAKTLPGHFYNKLYESFRSRFEVGLILEVVDKECISTVKLARINKIVGKRLYVDYYDNTGLADEGFWCHEDSPLIHPVGWATTVGHKLNAPSDYIERMNLAREQILDPNDDDATMDLFKLNFLYEEYFDSSKDDKVTAFCEGMKLEAIDPLNLSSICVATVMDVLKFGYIMIRIDSYTPDATGSDWFCYHEKSPCIFPVGFCKENGIPLTPPNGCNKTTFNWNSYLANTKFIPAVKSVFHRFSLNHGFKIGMKIECADLMDPRLVCVATVSRVVGRLLKIHFDGWEEEYDQWLDCESPDIYPVGWCVTVGHKLEGPRLNGAPKAPIKYVLPKSNAKKINKKGPKRKNAKEQHDRSANCSSGVTMPLTFIKQDDDLEEYGTYVIQQPSSHQQEQQLNRQQSYGGGMSSNSIKQELSSENSIISNFKNLQKNLELIEQQHMVVRQPTQIQQQQHHHQQQQRSFVIDDDDDDGDGNDNDEESDDEDDDIDGLNQYEDDDNDDITLSPLEWDCNDVIEFLKRSNCSQHCELFLKHKIDGKKLMKLTQNDIIQLLGMKVGPAIKVFDMIQQIKSKVIV